MGRRRSLFIPFLIEGGVSKKYGTCLVYDAVEKTLRTHLPRKSEDGCANCNQMLIDWNKLKGRSITCAGYSNAKHTVLSSLYKSFYADRKSEMKINGEHYRLYKVLSSQESEEKRRAANKKSIKNTDILPQISNSEGYGSSVGSPPSSDQPDSEIRSPNSEGYGSLVGSHPSTNQQDIEIRSPNNCSDYESEIDSTMLVDLNASTYGKFDELNYKHKVVAFFVQPLNISNMTHEASMFNQNWETLNSSTENNIEDEPMVQELDMSDLILEKSQNLPSYQALNMLSEAGVHDRSMSEALKIHGSVPETDMQNESADQGYNVDESIAQEVGVSDLMLESSKNLPLYQALNIMSEAVMHDKSLSEALEIQDSRPAINMQNESAHEGSGTLVVNLQDEPNGYGFPVTTSEYNPDNELYDQQLKRPDNAKDIPLTSAKPLQESDVSDADWDSVFKENNVSDADQELIFKETDMFDAAWDSKFKETDAFDTVWDSMLKDLSSIDLPTDCYEDEKDADRNERLPTLKYFKMSKEIVLGENAVLTFKPVGEVPLDPVSNIPNIYVGDELQIYKPFEIHPSVYGYVEFDVIQRIQASQVTEIKEIGDHFLLFLKPLQTVAPKNFFPDTGSLN